MMGESFMMKYKFASGLAFVAAWTCLATAQTSQAHLSSTRPTPDPLKTSTKPLTEKSANTPRHRSSAVPAQRSAGAGKTSAELTGLERQRMRLRGRRITPQARQETLPHPSHLLFRRPLVPQLGTAWPLIISIKSRREGFRLRPLTLVRPTHQRRGLTRIRRIFRDAPNRPEAAYFGWCGLPATGDPFAFPPRVEPTVR